MVLLKSMAKGSRSRDRTDTPCCLNCTIRRFDISGQSQGGHLNIVTCMCNIGKVISSSIKFQQIYLFLQNTISILHDKFLRHFSLKILFFI